MKVVAEIRRERALKIFPKCNWEGMSGREHGLEIQEEGDGKNM
jgi:hypothetical protein